MGENKKFEKYPGLFITGTDTGVGKTMVTGAIAEQLARQGKAVGVFKPIATGCQVRREGLVSSDAEFLAHCCDSGFSLEQINPIRYHRDLAPSVAAEMSQKPIDWQALQLAYQYQGQNSDFVLVEGIGGVMVPLSKDYMVLDLMQDMALGVLIVARNQLGTINHTLLTIDACRNRGLKVVGVVFNQYHPDGADLAQETNARVIQETSGVSVLAVIPYDENSSVEKGKLGSEVIAATALVKWEEYLTNKS